MCIWRNEKWGVDYWETYAPVLHWISLIQLLAIAGIHESARISIEFVLYFPQSDLDMDVFMEITLGMEVDKNRR